MGKESAERQEYRDKLAELVEEDVNAKNYALQLYDKGLLSKETLLATHGFDPEWENELIRFEGFDIGGKPNVATKIEQARRNAEVLLRFLSGSLNLKDNELKEIVKRHAVKNIEIK